MMRPLVLAISVLALFGPAQAGERDAIPTVTPDGGRVRQEGDRLDIYDGKNNRIGYGYVRPDGSADIYNLDGTRRATITPGMGGQPGRVIVPKYGK